MDRYVASRTVLQPRSDLGIRSHLLLSAELTAKALPYAGMGHGVGDLALLDQMPLGLAIYDIAGALVHANPCFSTLVSCSHLPSRAEAGCRWQGAAPDGSELAIDQFPCERALRGETVSPGIDLFHTGPGREGRWLNVSAAPISDPARNVVIGIVLLFLDVHEKTHASAFAARASRRFWQFAENSHIPIWIIDAETEAFSYRNPPHLALTHAEAPPAGLLDWLRSVEPADRATVRQSYALAFAGTSGQTDYRRRSGDGQAVYRMQETIFPIRDESGTVVMIGGMADGITLSFQDPLYVVGELRSLLADAPLDPQGGHGLKIFASLQELIEVAGFLAPGCVLVDLASTPDAETNLLPTLVHCRARLPVIVIGRAETTVDAAIAAMRGGATDYLVAPLAEDALAAALRRAAALLPGRHADQAPASDPSVDRLSRLSKREREVLAGLVQGGTNKSIGRDLGISPRTVELYRSRLMGHMNAHSLAELVKLAATMRL